MGSYFGSKATSGLCQAIIALMPPHDTYIETHLGGGAVMRNKPPARNNIAIDIDPEYGAAYYSRATLLTKLGREDDAAEDMKMVTHLTNLNIENFANDNKSKSNAGKRFHCCYFFI